MSDAISFSHVLNYATLFTCTGIALFLYLHRRLDKVDEKKG